MKRFLTIAALVLTCAFTAGADEGMWMVNAINKALVLFHREYDYEGALEAIKIPLNRVEAGAARKVEESYQEEKDRRYY